MSNVTVDFKSNKKEFLTELDRKTLLALAQMGDIVVGKAIRNCPVDTGRLKNSLTYKTVKEQSSPNGQGGAPAEPDDYKPREQPEENAVYVGTNVIYAARQEYGDEFKHKSGKAHFLRDAAQSNPEKLKKEVEKILKA